MKDAASEQIHAIRSVVLACALIDFVKVDAVLKGAVFDKRLVRDVFIIVCHAHGEAQVELWIGRHVGGAEFEDITQAFAGAMHTFDGIFVFGHAINRLDRGTGHSGDFLYQPPNIR